MAFSIDLGFYRKAAFPLALILFLNLVTYYAASILNKESYVANAFLIITGAPEISKSTILLLDLLILLIFILEIVIAFFTGIYFSSKDSSFLDCIKLTGFMGIGFILFEALKEFFLRSIAKYVLGFEAKAFTQALAFFFIWRGIIAGLLYTFVLFLFIAIGYGIHQLYKKISKN